MVFRTDPRACARLCEPGPTGFAPRPSEPGQHVAAAERAFDAYTAEHGLTAGFLAYSYSHLLWIKEEVERRGHALCIWRRDGRGPQSWRLVYDQFTPVEVPAG